MSRADDLSFRDEPSLADLVNRVLDRGALINGEVILGIAGVDLVYLGLQLAISSVESMEQRSAARRLRDGGDDPAAEPAAGGGPDGPTPGRPPR